jgi:hypothetical protein
LQVEKREIKIDDRDATFVEKMLQCVYTGDYTRDTPPEPEELVTPMPLSRILAAKGKETALATVPVSQFHAQMYAQGDYFQIEGLNAKARTALRRHSSVSVP